MRAVVPMAQRDEFRSSGLAQELPVLPGQLERRFNRVRATRAIEEARHAFGGQHLVQHARQFLRARMCYSIEQLKKLQLIELCGNGRFYLRAIMSNIDIPQPRRSIEKLPATVVVHITAVSSHDPNRSAIVPRRLHRMPEVRPGIHVSPLENDVTIDDRGHHFDLMQFAAGHGKWILADHDHVGEHAWSDPADLTLQMPMAR